MNFEVDTGSAVSIIPVSVYKTHLSEYKIQNTSMTLKGYSGTRIKIVGTVDVPVTHYGQSKILPLIIAEDKGPCLVGRDWLDKLILDWRSVFSVQRVYAVDELLLDFPEIFDEAVSGIKNFKAQIRVKDGAQPIFHKARPVPYSLKGQVEKELHRLEKEGIISKVEHSDWAAPIVVVPKSDGSIRICGDYKVTVNRTVPDEPYPIPNTDDLFATLAGGEKFTKLDLSHAYSQLELDSNSMEYLTVNTHVGLYQFNRLAYGVSSAPAIFQGVMDRVLNGIEGVVCRIDDILITAPSDEEHIKRLTEVLNRLKTHNIKLKKEKCTFMNDRVTYMGHVIDKEGIHPTNEKVQAIQNAPTPTNVTELKSYLGLLNYYGAFLPDLSTILEPLHKLLRKNARWAWDKDCENSFVKTKELVLKCDLLVHYDSDKPLKLACDASAYGVGCVLSHIIDGEERPIAFGSRTMTSSEKNYSQLEREALAIIYGVKKFHKYLYGRRFVLVTDNKPLSTILGPKKGVPTLAAARLQRWALILSAYDYEIECRKSADHSNCDSLSRLPLEQRWPDENTDFEDSKDEDWEVYFAVRNDGVPISSREVASATRTDPILSRVYSYTMNGWPSYVKDPELKPYFVRRSELSTDHGVVLWGMRVVIPTKLRAGVLAELHEEHIGMSRMKSLARSYVWWPNMDTQIEDVVSHCQVCQSVRKSAQPAPLMPWEYASRPWQRIHVDFASFKQQSFLVVTDSYSKWLEVVPMKSTTSERTVEELRSMCASWGIPEVIVSDNGPQFISAEFREFTRRNGIRHKLIPPWHPSSNGAAERAVQVLKQALKTQVVDVGNSNLSLRHRLARFLFKYRTVPHTVTGESPSSLFMKRELRSRLTLLRPNQAENIHAKQKTLDASHMERKGRAYVVGDTVSVKKYSQGGKWVWESGVVRKVMGPLTYLVDVGYRNRFCHVNQMLKSKVMLPAVRTADTQIHVPSVESGKDGGCSTPITRSTSADDACNMGTDGIMADTREWEMGPQLSQLQGSVSDNNQGPLRTPQPSPVRAPQQVESPVTAEVGRRYPTRNRKPIVKMSL
ncbi:MAG: RNase H-like domain-containing protein [Sedimenticola sp.]